MFRTLAYAARIPDSSIWRRCWTYSETRANFTARTPARLASNARRSRKSIQATPVEENHVPEEQEESDEVVSSDLDSLSDFMSSEDTSEDENGNVSSNNEEEDSDSGQSKNIFHKDLKATRLNFNDDNESM